MLHFLRLAVPVCLGGLLAAQVTIPPHASIYNGYSRGYNFTAQTAFVIVQLELPLDAFQAGDTAAFLVRVNGTTALHSVGNTGPAIPCSISIAPGDVVDIIGNWSPAAPGNFTAHNSYTATGLTPYPTTINGVPHTLMRCGWQWDIGVLPLTGTYLAPTNGQMGRVFMYTGGGSGTVLGTNTTLGQGCIRQYASFYESFATAAAFDLSNTTLTLLPSGAGGYVGLTGIGSFLPVGSVATPVTLTLGDDAEVTVPFTVGSFPGWTSFTVCSNGYVSKASGNGTGYTPAVATFLNASQDGFWCWHDFNPVASGSGQVKVEQSASVTTITWDGVWDFGGTSAANANTWQLQLHSSGQVVFAWQQMSGLGNGYLVGYSPGGPNQDPGSMDISSTPAFTTHSGDIAPLALLPTSRPVTGTSWSMTVGNIPATTVFGVMIGGGADPGILDLGFLGMPTCQLRATLDALAVFTPTGSTFPFSLGVPNNPALVNAHVFLQSAVFQLPPVNAFGAITSNGIDGKIGDY